MSDTPLYRFNPLFWKAVLQYRHDNGETVELYRHRLTGKRRQVWYEGEYYDFTDRGEIRV